MKRTIPAILLMALLIINTSLAEEVATETEISVASTQTEQPGPSVTFYASGLEDAFDLHLFTELGISGGEMTSTDDGVLLQSGVNEFTIEHVFDFGEQPVDRLEINALAQTETRLLLYLDEQTEPFADVLLNCDASGDFTDEKPLVIDLSAMKLTGSHTVRLSFSEDTAVLLRSMQFIQASVPVLYFTIDESQGTIADMNADRAHQAECHGSVTITVPDGYKGGYNINDAEPFAGGTYAIDYIRGRGNSSWTLFDKKPYKLKLTEDVDLFGMGANKHWTLLSGGEDHTMLDNRFTCYLADSVGLEYTVQCVNVDVYMNGRYLGNYLLSEQVRIDEDRIEIDSLMDDYNEATMTDLELSGGYLLGKQNNSSDQGEYSFTTEAGNTFTVVEPESDESFSYDRANAYISGFMQRIEDAVFGKANADGVIENVWDLMDLESTVKYFLIQYFSTNTDAYRTSSTYMYKARDVLNEDGSVTGSKLYWGPVWDFDMAWCKTIDAVPPEDDLTIADVWINHLLKHDETFQAALLQYWPEVRESLVNIAAEDGVLDGYVAEMLPSAIHNYQVNTWASMEDKLPASLRDATGENDPVPHIIREYYLQLIDNLKLWINTRITWMDEHIAHLRPSIATVRYMAEDTLFYEAEETFDSVDDYPEGIPVSEDPDLVFTGWTAYMKAGYGEEGGIKPFGPDSTPSLFQMEPIDDGYALIVNAVFKKRSEVVLPTAVTFEQETYDVVCDKGEKHLAYNVSINYSYTPADATETDFIWTVEDSNGCFWVADTANHCLTVYFSAPGDYVVTCRTCEGKESICVIHAVAGGQ